MTNPLFFASFERRSRRLGSIDATSFVSSRTIYPLPRHPATKAATVTHSALLPILYTDPPPVKEPVLMSPHLEICRCLKADQSTDPVRPHDAGDQAPRQHRNRLGEFLSYRLDNTIHEQLVLIREN